MYNLIKLISQNGDSHFYNYARERMNEKKGRMKERMNEKKGWMKRKAEWKERMKERMKKRIICSDEWKAEWVLTWTPFSHSCFHVSCTVQKSSAPRGSLSGSFIAEIKSFRNNWKKNHHLLLKLYQLKYQSTKLLANLPSF